jgi:hypothetical protein
MTDAVYRADGSLARQLRHNPDGSEWTSTYVYDDMGRLKTVRRENAAGDANVQVYEYDTAGRLARILSPLKDGRDRIAESYEYDTAGRRKKTVYVDMAKHQPNLSVSWAVEGTDSAYSAPGATTLTTLYNDRDQPAEFLFYDGAGRLLSRIEFRYDDAGNLVEEAQTNTTEVLPPEMLKSLSPAQIEKVRSVLGAAGDPIRRTHSYDEQGRRVGSRWGMGMLGGWRKTITYNDHGDSVEEILDHDQKEYRIDNRGKVSDAPTKASAGCSETRLRYDYDARGNWIKKTVECRSGRDGDFMRSSVELRAIEYFE